VLVDADDLHAVEPVRILDQYPLALGQDRVVGGVPRHPKTLGDPGNAQVLAHDAFQRPPQPAPRQLRARPGSLAGVLTPHVPAAGAPVAANRDQQHRGTPAQRLVRQPAGHRVARGAFAATTATPAAGFDNPARQHRTIRVNPLTDGFKSQLIEPAERGQDDRR